MTIPTNPTVASARWADASHNSIIAEIDGVTLAVPDDHRNADRQAIAAWEAAGNEIAEPPEPTISAEMIKAECARRIYAIASDNAQKNMMANAIAGNFDEDDVTAWQAGVAWIATMQTVCRELIAAGDATYAQDGHWPLCPESAAALAARY
jgi:hypothetical protein